MSMKVREARVENGRTEGGAGRERQDGRMAAVSTLGDAVLPLIRTRSVVYRYAPPTRTP